ncbi:MAG: hypothetical protein J0M13_17930 [Candidatus Accumulibacter sp.]|nr:hypothetical protein [Candidatus Accumulibacter necessarius]
MTRPKIQAGNFAGKGFGEFERMMKVFFVWQRMGITEVPDSNKKQCQTKMLSPV